MHFLGIDVGSSSVKLSVLDGDSGKAIASTTYPDSELAIQSPQTGWAEQDPNTWWQCIEQGCAQLFNKPGVDASRIAAVGISYQMHGLVLVDKDHKVLRPAIIWCDSRAVELGNQALVDLGANYCFGHLLNSPGNFTAAKLRWVQQNEPAVFAQVHKMMLPGDYIAMKLSGEITTTASGLSEGTLWDFESQSVAKQLLSHWNIDTAILPDILPSIGLQVKVNAQASKALGLPEGIPVAYRGGDQPNNAFSLNVLQPGEVAATAGTSGVIYGVTDQKAADVQSRVNTFLHVTNSSEAPRNGVLVCVNGAGRSYSWLRQLLGANGQSIDYGQLNSWAANTPVGADGLIFHPFGNGAERIFQNRTLGASFSKLELNRHGVGHMIRATQEGIVFALNQGFDVLKSLGGECKVVRVGYGNMFLSDVFAQAFANTTRATVECYNTDGAEGAARAAAIGSGFYASAQEAFSGLVKLKVIEPQADLMDAYGEAYNRWVAALPV